jgi:hypothetical protein
METIKKLSTNGKILAIGILLPLLPFLCITSPILLPLVAIVYWYLYAPVTPYKGKIQIQQINKSTNSNQHIQN